MMIPLPALAGRSCCRQHQIVHSQGLLHYICQEYDTTTGKLFCLSVWVLKDYDAKEWVRKDFGCLPKLIGKLNFVDQLVAMHEDCNVLFFHQALKLIAYDMDRKEESVLTTSGNKTVHAIVAAYVPYFADLPVLSNRT